MAKKKEENLIPFNKRTESERREIAKKAGIASGAARRAKKTRRETVKMISELPVQDKRKANAMIRMGLPEDSLTNDTLITVNVFKQAAAGNLNAVEKWEQWQGDEEREHRQFLLPANFIGKAFVDINREIVSGNEYVFKGGRGSLKSSFVAGKVIEILMNNPDTHACIIRKVSNTLKDSVYAKIKWAITKLGLEKEWRATKSPLEITRIETGQKIYFRGADDPDKIKSITPEFGYITVLWFEEADQMSGAAECRKIEQSVLRGGELSYNIKTYNPPKTKSNWLNKYVLLPKQNLVVHHSTYRDAPLLWLGENFINEAEFLKEINPEAYEHEYEGVPNGEGGAIFDFLELREISDEEIKEFDRIREGVDWGFFPDPYGFIRLHYDSAHETIYLIDELYVKKKRNSFTAKWIIENNYVDDVESYIYCDSSEKKSVEDYKDLGIWNAKAVRKGPGSVEYSMKWLQGRKIVIDKRRTPNAYKEFTEYEYERDRDGEVISGYPDENNHLIDATRYALSDIWQRRFSQA